MPRIKVSSDHHNFILQIRAGNFADDVHSLLVVVKLGFKIDRQLHAAPFLNHPHKTIVVFRRDDDLNGNLRSIFVVRIDSSLRRRIRRLGTVAA